MSRPPVVRYEEKIIDVGDGVLVRTKAYSIKRERTDKVSFVGRDREPQTQATAAATAIPLLLLHHSAPESLIHKLLFGVPSDENENRRNNKEGKITKIITFKFPENVMEKSFIEKRGTDYGIDVLAKDAVNVMKKGYGYNKFHVCGCPVLCSIITQYLIIYHSSSILSATIISSTPLSLGAPINKKQDSQEEVKLENIRLQDIHPGQLPLYCTTHAKELCQDAACAELDGDTHGIDQFRALRAFVKVISRSEPSDRRPQLRITKTPTLIIHGTDDPYHRYEHGVALAEAIPGAELMTIDKGTSDLITRDSSNIHEDAMIERMLELIYDCWELSTSTTSPISKKKVPQRFSVRYSGFCLDIQTVDNGMGEWITKDNLRGSVISRGSVSTKNSNKNSYTAIEEER